MLEIIIVTIYENKRSHGIGILWKLIQINN